MHIYLKPQTTGKCENSHEKLLNSKILTVFFIIYFIYLVFHGFYFVRILISLAIRSKDTFTEIFKQKL